MKKLIIITGPTAVGKTEYAIKAAQNIDGEIVSADSMQLYKYMNIGSAKPSPEELAQVKHHLVDEFDPAEDFSAAKYTKYAKAAINDIFSRKKIPVVSGGTGLYLNALIYEMDFGTSPANSEYREELTALAMKEGGEKLHEMLASVNPKLASDIHPNNVKKLIRALEREKFSGESGKCFSEVRKLTEDYEVLLIGLTRDREELYDRINRRVDMLVRAGLIEEVKSLLEMGLTEESISMKGIGYKEIIPYLTGEYDLERAIELVKRNTRHYAKRQMTWFRRYEDMNWINLTDNDDALTEMMSVIDGYLD